MSYDAKTITPGLKAELAKLMNERALGTAARASEHYRAGDKTTAIDRVRQAGVGVR